MRSLDHLILGASELSVGVEGLSERLGVEPVFGGRHPRWGTANYLLSLGPSIYIEVLGPDPDAEVEGSSPLLDLLRSEEPRLVTWAAKASDLEGLVESAARRGVDLGAARSGSRTQPDGTELTWGLTDPTALPADGLVPFFIDWRDSPHPGDTTPSGGELITLHAEHPDPPRVQALLAALDLDLGVAPGRVPALMARIRTPSGAVVEIR